MSSSSQPISKIMNGLYIGNSFCSRTEQVLRDHSITAVVNVARDLDDPTFPGIQTLKFGIVDGESTDNLPITYFCAARTVIELMKAGQTVLLHCHEGVSRSGAIGLLVVMKLLNLSSGDALDYLRKQRSIIRIHPAHLKICDLIWIFLKGTTSAAG